MCVSGRPWVPLCMLTDGKEDAGVGLSRGCILPGCRTAGTATNPSVHPGLRHGLHDTAVPPRQLPSDRHHLHSAPAQIRDLPHCDMAVVGEKGMSGSMRIRRRIRELNPGLPRDKGPY